MPPEIFLALVILLALGFAFFNGANDLANSIAPLVRTAALSPRKAVTLAAVFNFLGPCLILIPIFGAVTVAKTFAKGIVDPIFVNQSVVLAGLLGAIAWSGLATKKGIPVSITHALIGGVMGAGLLAGGLQALNWHILVIKILPWIVVAPLFGGALGGIILILVKQFTFRVLPKTTKYQANLFWRRAQIGTGAFLSFTHGLNDGQSATGIIALGMFAAGFTAAPLVQPWMILIGGLGIGLGTYVYGYRVVKTVGWRISQLSPVDGFSAEAGASLVILLKSLWGIPVSTTHVAVGSVMGTGGVRNIKKLNWQVSKEIITAWFLTIPAAGIVGAGAYFLLQFVI